MTPSPQNNICIHYIMEDLGEIEKYIQPTPQIFCVGFVVRHSVPDALAVCDSILERYKDKFSDFSLGEDTTYMEGEEPHYHLNFITLPYDKRTARVITKRSLEKVRESSWHFGQKLSLKISPLSLDISFSDLSFLAYAGKERLIKHSLTDECRVRQFNELAEKALLTKKAKHAVWEKEHKKKLAKKDLKERVLEYIGGHWDEQVEQCRAWCSVPGNTQLLNDNDFHDCEICKIILEKFQLEEKRHFRPFEIDRFVCEYFREKFKDPIKMFLFRNNRHRPF